MTSLYSRRPAAAVLSPWLELLSSSFYQYAGQNPTRNEDHTGLLGGTVKFCLLAFLGFNGALYLNVRWVAKRAGKTMAEVCTELGVGAIGLAAILADLDTLLECITGLSIIYAPIKTAKFIASIVKSIADYQQSYLDSHPPNYECNQCKSGVKTYYRAGGI